MLANHGRTRKYDRDFEGVNSRLDGLQAAILSAKLRHLEDWTERRRQAAYRYNQALTGVGVVTPIELDNVRAVYHLYVVRVPNGRRAALQEH
jgi:dTDP-4-amino-4,6-dideoxygalactose transaminase